MCIRDRITVAGMWSPFGSTPRVYRLVVGEGPGPGHRPVQAHLARCTREPPQLLVYCAQRNSEPDAAVCLPLNAQRDGALRSGGALDVRLHLQPHLAAAGEEVRCR